VEKPQSHYRCPCRDSNCAPPDRESTALKLHERASCSAGNATTLTKPINPEILRICFNNVIMILPNEMRRPHSAGFHVKCHVCTVLWGQQHLLRLNWDNIRLICVSPGNSRSCYVLVTPQLAKPFALSFSLARTNLNRTSMAGASLGKGLSGGQQTQRNVKIAVHEKRRSTY
jgi:hypothetical protein